MRRTILASSALLVLAIAAVAAFLLWRRHPPSPAPRPAAQASLIVQLEMQDGPPRPDISLQINSAHELEVCQGTPLILTVRVANERAANAAASLRAHEAYLSLIQEEVAEGELTGAEAQPMLELARQKPEIKVVRIGAGSASWAAFLHFEVGGAGARPERLAWPLRTVTAAQSTILTLDATASAQVDYALSPDAAAQIPAGEYSAIAVLEVTDSAAIPRECWRGRVESRPVTLKISPIDAQRSTATQAGISMQRAEFFAYTKDWGNALASAEAALLADPNLIRAEMILGEAKEAQGDLSGAREAFLTAMRLFDAQFPTSYEAPQYLMYRIATLDGRLGSRFDSAGVR